MKRSEIIQMENKNGIYYLSKDKFFHGLKRRQQRDELFKMQAVMPLIRDDADLLLKLDAKENLLHDGNGNAISSNERGYLLDEMIGRRHPLRAENLDNEFHLIDGIWIMNYNFREVNNNYQFEGKEINPLLRDGYIALNDLDEDGLAKKVGNGLIYYTYPRDNSGARLDSYSDRVGLYCNGNLGGSNGALAVRAKFLSLPEDMRK